MCMLCCNMPAPGRLRYCCSAPGCTSKYYFPVTDKKFRNPRFFRFPEPSDSARRARWFEAIGIAATNKRCYLCEEHFEEHSFVDTFKRTLPKFAVPLAPKNIHVQDVTILAPFDKSSCRSVTEMPDIVPETIQNEKCDFTTPMVNRSRRACSVLGCVTKNEESVFCAPNPKKSWDLFISWVKATGNPKFLNMGHHKKTKVFICQKHFTDEECALLKMRIKSFAPTLKLPEPLNLHFGIDANIPESTGSHLVSARQLEQEDPALNTEADTNRGLLTGLTCKTEDLEYSEASEADTNKGLLTGLTCKTEDLEHSEASILHHSPPKPKPVFFPLFIKGSPKSVDPLKLDFGMDVTNPGNGGTHMLSSQQKRKEPPVIESSTRKRLLTEQSMVQQLSGSRTEEMIYDTKHVELSDTSVSHPSISCVDLHNLISSSSLHSKSAESDGGGSVIQLEPSHENVSSLVQSSSLKSNDRSPKLLTLTTCSRRKFLTLQNEALYLEACRLKNKVYKLSKQRVSFRKQLRNARIVFIRYEKLLSSLNQCKKRFFMAQFGNIKSKGKGNVYSLDEKIDSLLLWRSNQSAYVFLKRIGFILPSVATLRRVLAQIPIIPGLNEPVFEQMKRKIDYLSDKGRVCNLLIDEMVLKQNLEYSFQMDRVSGFETNTDYVSKKVADHVTVFMLRGVFKKWKQPVGYYFSYGGMPAATRVKIIKKICEKVSNVGLNILAMICDQSADNITAISILHEETKYKKMLAGEAYDNTEILIDNHTIIPLYDPPHLLKSLRNNLISKDLEFIQGGKRKVASWSHIIAAYNIDQSNNIGVLRKITDQHIRPGKMEKMKVSLAAQVFSQTVAAGVKYCALSELKSADGVFQLDTCALDTADLLLFFDEVFDSMNCGFSKKDVNVLKNRVSSKSRHEYLWVAAIKVISTMKFVQNATSDRPPVLDGWIKTLTGLLEIKKILTNCGWKTFACRAFNQDPLENFFGKIRQLGAPNSNPTCSAFSCYYKVLLMKNLSYSSRSNCENDGNSCLVSLKNMFGCSLEPESYSWSPSDVESEDVSQVEITALGYLSNFIMKVILNKVSSSCKICKINVLRTDKQPDEYHHFFLNLGENDSTMCLKYCKVDLIINIMKMHNLLKILLPSAIYFNNIHKRLISFLRSNIDFNFAHCPHKDEIEQTIFESFVKTFIFYYIKKLNKILMGKCNPSKKNDIERMCFNSYRKKYI